LSGCLPKWFSSAPKIDRVWPLRRSECRVHGFDELVMHRFGYERFSVAGFCQIRRFPAECSRNPSAHPLI
jgi:hypothetical protein